MLLPDPSFLVVSYPTITGHVFYCVLQFQDEFCVPVRTGPTVCTSLEPFHWPLNSEVFVRVFFSVAKTLKVSLSGSFFCLSLIFRTILLSSIIVVFYISQVRSGIIVWYDRLMILSTRQPSNFIKPFQSHKLTRLVLTLSCDIAVLVYCQRCCSPDVFLLLKYRYSLFMLSVSFCNIGKS